MSSFGSAFVLEWLESSMNFQAYFLMDQIRIYDLRDLLNPTYNNSNRINIWHGVV